MKQTHPTLVYKAIKERRWEDARHLVQSGDIEDTDVSEHADYLLHEASDSKQFDIVQSLLQNGVRPVQDSDLLLDEALDHSRQDIIHILVKESKDAAVYASKKLKREIQYNNIRNATLLLECGVTIGQDGEELLLHTIENATDSHDTALLEQLLKNKVGVGVLATNKGNATFQEAVEIATGSGNSKIISLLLEHGASPNITTETGMPLLFIPATEGDAALTSLLLDHGARVNTTYTMEGQPPKTVLDQVTKLKGTYADTSPEKLHISSVESLLREHGALSYKQLEKLPLFIALQERKWNQALELLGTEQSSIDLTPDQSKWLLVTAFKNNRPDHIILLLDHGADTTKFGEYLLDEALDSAQRNRDFRIAEVLLERKVGIDILHNSTGEFYLFIAIKTGDHTLAKLLLDHGMDINLVKSYSNIFFAPVREGHVDVVALLLDKGADINQLSTLGDTPLDSLLIEKKLLISKEKLTPAEQEKLAKLEKTESLLIERGAPSSRLKKKQIKAEIESSQPITSQPEDKKPSTPEAIESIIFTQETTHTPHFKGHAEVSYCETETLPAMMDVIAIAGLGGHDAAIRERQKDHGKNKDFRILISKTSDVGGIIARESAGTMGLYTHKNTAFASYDEKVTVPGQELGHWGTVAHEAFGHAALMQIFNNKCLPYEAGDVEKEKQYAYIVEQTKSTLASLPQPETPMEKAIHTTLNSTFDDYEASKHAIELVVRPIEIAAQFGKAGELWLEKHFPELYAYHMDVIVPAAREWAKTHEIDEYIDTERNSELLTKTADAQPVVGEHTARFKAQSNKQTGSSRDTFQ